MFLTGRSGSLPEYMQFGFAGRAGDRQTLSGLQQVSAE
jgi:hypothetical protein